MAADLQHSITHRLASPALGLAVIMALLTLGTQILLQTRSCRDHLDDEAQALLRLLQPQAIQHLQDASPPQWQPLLQHPGVHALYLHDTQERLLFSQISPQSGAYSRLGQLLLGSRHPASLELRDGGRTLGRLDIELDTGTVSNHLSATLWMSGTAAVLCVLAAAILQLLYSHRLLTRPLAELGSQLSHLDADKAGVRLLARPPAHVGNEIGLWVDRTNQLITSLARSERMRELAEYRLSSLGRLDQLTGLPNRSLLLQNLSQLLHDSAHQHGRLALHCLGLDDFQSINERYGYEVGDHLLAQLASRLRQHETQAGCLGRLGSDQFVLVQTGVRQAGDAADLASTLLALLQEPLRAGPHIIRLSATIGISLYPDDGLSPESLLQGAEQTMTLAKRSARSHYRFYIASVDQQIRQQREMEHDLRLALDHGELELHFQPQISLHDQQIGAAEVLLRWNHPQRGLVMPDQFIPLAERSELIGQISDWILETSCRQLQQWLAEGLRLRLAINLSTRQLHNQQLPARMRQLLERYQLPARSLELEITETGLMEDIDSATRQLYSLRQSGVLLAIDDFGTGYSSLGYLKTLPLDKLKIDKSFIHDLGNSEDASIVLAIIQLARNLGLAVLAEGVETAVQEAYLLRHGCEEAQGYRYGRPMPAARFASFLHEYQQQGQPPDNVVPLH